MSVKQSGSETPTGKLQRSATSQNYRKYKSSFKSPMRRDDPQTIAKNEESLMGEIERLTKQESQLDQEICELEKMGLSEEDYKLHIDKLHEYNEMKDVGQMLLGQIAVQRGITVKDLYEEYGLSLED